MNVCGRGEILPLPILQARNSSIRPGPECICSLDMQRQYACALEGQIAVHPIDSIKSDGCRTPYSSVWTSSKCSHTVTRQSLTTRQSGDLFVTKTIQAILRAHPNVVFAVFEKTPYTPLGQPVGF